MTNTASVVAGLLIVGLVFSVGFLAGSHTTKRKFSQEVLSSFRREDSSSQIVYSSIQQHDEEEEEGEKKGALIVDSEFVETVTGNNELKPFSQSNERGEEKHNDEDVSTPVPSSTPKLNENVDNKVVEGLVKQDKADKNKHPLNEMIETRTRKLGSFEEQQTSITVERGPDCGSCCVENSLLVEKELKRALYLSPNKDPLKKEQNIKYIKTHKTGSSTLGSIMYRFGARHDLVMYKSPSHGLKIDAPKNQNTVPSNIVVHHYAGIATNLRSIEQWDRAYEWYNEVVPNGKYITIVRDPISHYLSYFSFYNEPGGRTLDSFVERGNNKDILMRDFGVRTKVEMDKFMELYADKFYMILVANRMSESLVAMAYMLNWSLWDLTYVSLLDSSKDGFKRWDGKPVKKTLKESQLSPDLLQKLESLTKLDKIFYEYADKELDKIIERIGPKFQATVRQFDALNKALNKFCNCKDLGDEESQMCFWYDLPDLKYERSISEIGHARPFSISYFEKLLAK
eukprot:m.13994 g.13994  ORF g.13994 m.13994 type:complete len:512 (+) comp4237_c0_seq1:24-1559(+)